MDREPIKPMTPPTLREKILEAVLEGWQDVDAEKTVDVLLSLCLEQREAGKVACVKAVESKELSFFPDDNGLSVRAELIESAHSVDVSEKKGV